MAKWEIEAIAQSHQNTPPSLRAPDRGAARRQAFQAAARIEFLEKGFEAACVNNVVRAAGGSLATLYAQFNNKEGLFLAVAEEQHEQLVAAMTPPCVAHLSLEDGLQVIGERFLTALISRENLAFYRIVIGEGRKFPQLLQRYVFAGADRIRNVVAAHLERTARDIEDADMVASYFLEAVRSRHHYRALADDGYTLREEELSEHVSRSVRFFLAGARAL